MYCYCLGARPEPTTLWATTRDETLHAWRIWTIIEWIREAYNAIGASSPPPGNSSGHRIAYRKARRPPPHASALSSAPAGGGPGGGCARRPVGTYLYLYAVGARNSVPVHGLAR
jgi:hypothetical protein